MTVNLKAIIFVNCAKLDAVVLACKGLILLKIVDQATRVATTHQSSICWVTFWVLWLSSGTHFLIWRPSTNHHQGFNMYMRFKVPSFFFVQQWIKCMLYWKKLCGKVLIIPKYKTFNIHFESFIFFSLFYDFIKLFTGESVHYIPFVQK